jgi:hypothetical protein
MFGETRQEPGYLYFTNDAADDFPGEFAEWRHFPASNQIRKISHEKNN